MEHFDPIEGLAGFFKGDEAFGLEVSLGDGIRGLCVVGTDARACTQQLITEVCDGQQLNRDSSSPILLNSFLFLLTCPRQEVVIQLDYLVLDDVLLTELHPQAIGSKRFPKRFSRLCGILTHFFCQFLQSSAQHWICCMHTQVLPFRGGFRRGWSLGHHAHDAFLYVVHLGEVATIVVVVVDLDGLAGYQLEVGHIWPSSRAIHRKEAQTRCGDII